MRSLILLLRTVVLPILMLLAAEPLLAQEPIERLTTSSGVLSIASATGTACVPSVQCHVVLLGKKVMFKDAYARFVSIYPSKENPRLVEVQTSTGGNACCWENRLIDFTASPPIVVKGVSGGKISAAENGVLIEEVTETNDLGDWVAKTFTYTWGAGSAVPLRTAPVFSRTSLKQKKALDDVLSDPEMREPVLQVIGAKSFKEFRINLSLGGPIKIVDSRYVVGSGCRPHFCCGQASIFVLDTQQKTAWALQSEHQFCKPDNGKAQMWGTLTTEDVVPRRELTQWLIEQKVSWNSVFVVDAVPVSNQSARPAPAVTPAIKASPSAPIQGIEVAMVRRGGTYAVPVLINGAITLDFVLDSGATDVSIPSDVFSTLIRTGTITKEDILGNETYTLADGSRKKAATFNIRSLKVGATVVENVRASVVDDGGPLLLGMSFLGRFRSWEVNTDRHALILK